MVRSFPVKEKKGNAQASNTNLKTAASLKKSAKREWDKTMAASGVTLKGNKRKRSSGISQITKTNEIRSAFVSLHIIYAYTIS